MSRGAATALFVGASIVDAGRRQDPRGGLGSGFVRRIAERMAAEGRPIEVVNAGVSGDRTADLLARWDADVIAARPALLTVLVGTNDMLRRYDAASPTSAEGFAAAYAEMLERARAAIDLERLVVMEPFLLPLRPEQRRWHEEDLHAKLVALRAVAADHDATHIPLDVLFAERASAIGAEALVVDGVHPTAEGDELIAAAWWAAAMPDR